MFPAALRTLTVCLALLSLTCVKGTQPDKAKDPREDKEAKASEQEGSASAPTMNLKGDTDWNSLGEEARDVLKSDAPQIDPETISLSGIPDSSRGFAGVKETGFRVSYAPSKDPVIEKIRQSFQKEQVFEAFANSLNQTLNIPSVIDIHLVDCGTVNAFYDPKNSRIILCYELITYFLQVFEPVTKTSEELGTAAVGATFFAFFHELGHSLVDVLQIPVTGREEDAVDQLATIVLLKGGEEGAQAALAGAQWFLLKSVEYEKNPEAARALPFWDEHSLDQQRFYNIACLIYGSDPGKYKRMLSSGILPEPRALRCPQEYQKFDASWKALLKPHLKEKSEAGPVVAGSIGVPGEGSLGKTTSPPSSGGADCKSATLHIVELMTREAVAELEGLPPEKLKEAEDELTLTLPLMGQAIYEACLDEKWSAKTIECVQRASSSKEGEKCIP